MGMDLSTGPKKKGRHTPEMNVTPLVDVVLVLLIIFMVITPAMFKQLWITIPNEPEDLPAEAIDPSQPLVISVNAEGGIRINRDVVPDAVFPSRLTRVLAARGDRKVFFDAHDDVSFERAAEAMDLSREGGATTIAVMTKALPR
ncbi:MAG: biopolymer transporter ExbD [Myxococcales bacterium]|nr:biopolymer transporter ExbD [Myxococcales bacterium]